VLCAYGDATTRLRDEASRTLVQRFEMLSDSQIQTMLSDLESEAAKSLAADGVDRREQETIYQIDMRYAGQGMKLTVDVTEADLRAEGLAGIAKRFDRMHEQLFTFALDAGHELVGLRAVVQGPQKPFIGGEYGHGGTDPSRAAIERTRVYVSDVWESATIYARGKLEEGNRIEGPAIIVEMDATTLILPDHTGVVDTVGNILIWPTGREGQMGGRRATVK
jgi:N-methylhydantoinase A